MAPPRRSWTAAEEHTIRQMREAGTPFAVIGQRLRVHKQAVNNFCRERGIVPVGRQVGAPSPRIGLGRDPLPAGHPYAMAILADARMPDWGA